MLKLKAVVLYILKKTGDLDIHRLFKILYFADSEHYAKHGRRIIQDTFYAFPYGPVPSVLYDATKETSDNPDDVRNTSFSIISNSIFKPDANYIISAKEDPNMDELSISDIEMIEKSISDNLYIGFKDLSIKSHDIAWKEGHNKPNMMIDPHTMAIARGADEAMMNYIREQEEIDALIN